MRPACGRLSTERTKRLSPCPLESSGLCTAAALRDLSSAPLPQPATTTCNMAVVRLEVCHQIRPGDGPGAINKLKVPWRTSLVITDKLIVCH